jgi:hypothetical protein
MMEILLNETSTCRGELKKLAKILVRLDPTIFPPIQGEESSFNDKTAPEIRSAIARMAKEKKPHRPHEPRDVRAIVIERLGNFEFLNHPPTITVSLSLPI